MKQSSDDTKSIRSRANHTVDKRSTYINIVEFGAFILGSNSKTLKKTGQCPWMITIDFNIADRYRVRKKKEKMKRLIGTRRWIIEKRREPVRIVSRISNSSSISLKFDRVLLDSFLKLFHVTWIVRPRTERPAVSRATAGIRFRSENADGLSRQKFCPLYIRSVPDFQGKADSRKSSFSNELEFNSAAGKIKWKMRIERNFREILLKSYILEFFLNVSWKKKIDN